MTLSVKLVLCRHYASLFPNKQLATPHLCAAVLSSLLANTAVQTQVQCTAVHCTALQWTLWHC